MAGAFSGHLLNAFNNGPAQSIVTSGAMSFDARAGPSSPTLFGFTPLSEDSATSKQIATLQAKLNKKLGPEYISQRPGPGGGPKLTYAEGWKIINLANEVFGFNGWSSSIVSLSTDFIDYNEESKKYNVGVTAIVRVTLRDGVYHEDVGYGMLENGKSKAAALDKCKKEAITDALKRTLRNFGNLLGNCLYDKSYAQEVVKIKVPPVKLDKNELYRPPEFEERVLDASAPVPDAQAAAPETPTTRQEESRIKVEPETPITYVPRHLRQEMAVAAQAQNPARTPVTPPHRISTSGSGSGVQANRSPPADAPKPNGLATPIQTPSRVQRPPPPRAPPPRVVATSPLSRQPSVPERNVSFAEPVPVSARTASVEVMDQLMDDINQTSVHVACNNDDDDDAFPLSTQDDAFLATVDLGEGDLGRPIDFDEGTSSISVMDAPELELDVVLPQPEPQVRDRTGSEPGAGPSKVTTRNEDQLVAKLPSSTPHAQPNVAPWGAQPSRSGPFHTTSAPASTSMRTGPPAQDSRRPSASGFHYPPGVKPAVQHTSKAVAPACVRTSTPQHSGPSNANAHSTLKRNAEVMQSGSSPSTRTPIQGMALAQRQQQQHHDPKRLKR